MNSDKKKQWGGKREGAGRPSKAEEYKLIEQLDKAIEPTQVIELMREMIFEKHDKQVLTLYLGYRFGKPTEHKKIELDQFQPIFQPPTIEVDNETID